jgi:hypothetical protein
VIRTPGQKEFWLGWEYKANTHGARVYSATPIMDPKTGRRKTAAALVTKSPKARLVTNLVRV